VRCQPRVLTKSRHTTPPLSSNLLSRLMLPTSASRSRTASKSSLMSITPVDALMKACHNAHSVFWSLVSVGGELTRSMSSERERGSGVYLAGARAALPFALATFVLGISFGVLARSLGWGVVAPIVFSVIAFSGSAQFAVAAVLGAGGGALAAIVAAILLNSRFLPMGVAVAPFLKGGPLRRALEGQAVVDASWALASRGGGRFDREFMIGATLPQVAAWICGTVIGVLGSDVVGDVERLGLDAIFPAFFMALLVDELRSGGQTIVAALIAAALSLALVPLVPPGVPVIAACAAALLGLRGWSS
jgi:4-azaleucine resistance transporter AzlC